MVVIPCWREAVAMPPPEEHRFGYADAGQAGAALWHREIERR